MSRHVVVDDPVILRLLPRLSRAAALSHSGRSFLEHLLGTWRILADWGMPPSVCRAGFLHSAYATSFYPDALYRLEQRHVLRRAIGDDAEDLVFRFCTMDRRGIWDSLVAARASRRLTYPDRTRSGILVRSTRETLYRLLIIESANIAEQSRARDGGPAPWMSRLLTWWAFLPQRRLPVVLGTEPVLSSESDERAIEAYRASLAAPPRRALTLLEDAVRLNPWAAEPRILRALLIRNHGAFEVDELREARRLAAAWAVSWDRRISAAGWRALCDRLCRAPPQPARTMPVTFESISGMLAGRTRKPAWLAA